MPTQPRRQSTSEGVRQRRMSASLSPTPTAPVTVKQRRKSSSSQAAQRRLSVSNNQSPDGRRMSNGTRRLSIGAYTLPVSAPVLPDGVNKILGKRFKPENIPDFGGRVALVTGGTTGVGYFDALELALAGAKVIIVSTTASWHGKQAEIDINEALKECESKGSVVWHAIDMSSLKAVDDLATKILKEEQRLDILMCSAGIGQTAFVMTGDGLEKHFEVNSLAHYVFALRLLPLMQRTAAFAAPGTVRIVMQSSELHRMAPVTTRFWSKEEVNTVTEETQLYGRTKLGVIYLVRELVKRKLATYPPGTVPVLAMAVHPGSIDAEVLKNCESGPIAKLKRFLSRLSTMSDEQGAEACLWAATCTDINKNEWKSFQGKYFSEAYGKADTESKLAKDEEVAENFWELCAECTKEQLGVELRVCTSTIC
ncbi:NAD-P-binding protein [Trametes gibbosa]|nr:NAD-P-binding protein [Trametes gibbosa]